jgi:hypothetical protein
MTDNPDFTRRCACRRCNICFDCGKAPAELCPNCARIKHREETAWEALQLARSKDTRFQPHGQACHYLITIPGGLDGYSDGQFWTHEIPALVEVDPSVVGLRCIRDGETFEICAGGRLEKI